MEPGIPESLRPVPIEPTGPPDIPEPPRPVLEPTDPADIPELPRPDVLEPIDPADILEPPKPAMEPDDPPDILEPPRPDVIEEEEKSIFGFCLPNIEDEPPNPSSSNDENSLPILLLAVGPFSDENSSLIPAIDRSPMLPFAPNPFVGENKSSILPLLLGLLSMPTNEY